jgi:hypothetical protein
MPGITDKKSVNGISTVSNMIDGMSEYCSPLFVVGMPRSGTKLLRRLIDNHSLIAIAPSETHFLPYFHDKFECYGDLSKRKNFDRFWDDLKNFSFFINIHQSDEIWKKEQFFNSLTAFTFQDVFDTLLKKYAEFTGKVIYGDKTPEYLVQIPLLKNTFPNSKFIHIVRDARDYCLSIRSAWNKNIYRAAHRWRTSIKKCRADADRYCSEDYLEIRYETLIDQPEKMLQKVCRFIDVPYEPKMALLKKPSENLGDTKGRKVIVSQNYNKWKMAFSKKEIQGIESIAGNLLVDLGYVDVENPGADDIGKIRETFFKMMDGYYLILFQMKQLKSFREGLKRIYFSYKTRLR